MQAVMFPSWMAILIIVIAVWVLMSVLSPKRARGPQPPMVPSDGGLAAGPRRCRACGMELPGYAVYCPKCGQRL